MFTVNETSPAAELISPDSAGQSASLARPQGCLTGPQLFGMLGDGTRLQILSALRGRERDVTELCGALRMPQPTVSHHLGLLRVAGLLVYRRVGKRHLYRLGNTVTTMAGGGLLFTSADGCDVRLHLSAGSREARGAGPAVQGDARDARQEM